MPERVCHGCGAAMRRGDPIPRDGSCDGCGRDLRCCRNCQHWDERASGECRETDADLVQDKWRRNFCEFFIWSQAPFVADASASRAVEARAKLGAAVAAAHGWPADIFTVVEGPAAGTPALPGLGVAMTLGP